MSVTQLLISYFVTFTTFISGIFAPLQTLLKLNTSSSRLNPLSIQSMRERSYPGSDITIEQVLSPESSYSRYITSYESDGLKIYALLLVPKSKAPPGGYPVIILNHGYIIPELYTPEGNYVAHMDAFAKAGYVVFKPNFRGYGKSEGAPGNPYFMPDYTIDDLNAISSIKKLKEVNPEKIGVWGHSMGGAITLRDLVIDTKDIKAAAIWSGVVGDFNDLIFNWQNSVSYQPNAEDLALRNKNLNILLGLYGTPQENPDAWDQMDPTHFVSDIKAPVQLSVGLGDTQVPPVFSEELYVKLKDAGKIAELYEYPGANHDINQSFTEAMERTINFFNHYLK
jgi:dipeptidyl aminopeptidase/acylaminoacyl peptidase